MLCKILDLKETSKMLKVSDSTIYKWVEGGKIPFVKIGKKLLFIEKDIDDLIMRERVPARLEDEILCDNYLSKLKRI